MRRRQMAGQTGLFCAIAFGQAGGDAAGDLGAGQVGRRQGGERRDRQAAGRRPATTARSSRRHRGRRWPRRERGRGGPTTTLIMPAGMRSIWARSFSAKGKRSTRTRARGGGAPSASSMPTVASPGSVKATNGASSDLSATARRKRIDLTTCPAWTWPPRGVGPPGDGIADGVDPPVAGPQMAVDDDAVGVDCGCRRCRESRPSTFGLRPAATTDASRRSPPRRPRGRRR